MVDKLSAVWAGFGNGIFLTINGSDELNLQKFRPAPSIGLVTAEMQNLMNKTGNALLLKNLFDSGKERVQWNDYKITKTIHQFFSNWLLIFVKTWRNLIYQIES